MTSSVRSRPLFAAALIACTALGPALYAAPSWDDVRGTYRGVLALRAAGEDDRALEALSDLETPLAGDGESGHVEKLFRLKLRAIKDLLDQPEVLVPIIQLHHDAYVYYREHRQPALATHSRTMAEELSEVYVERAEGKGARVEAARVLTSLAGYLQDGLAFSTAATLYDRAIQFDPGDGAALYGLGCMFEKVGQYGDAVARFARLTEIDPQNAEARLRLGLNLLRSGERRRGEASLAELAAGSAPSWVLSLAAQELARLYAGSQRTAQAIALLRGAAARLPDDGGPRLALAFLLERSGDHRGALAAAQSAVRLAGQGDARGPRARYNGAASTALDEVRVRLRESARPRLRLLTAALEAASAAETPTP